MNKFSVLISYDGFVVVEADSEEEAAERIRQMTTDEMYLQSDGRWVIKKPELNCDFFENCGNVAVYELEKNDGTVLHVCESCDECIDKKIASGELPEDWWDNL